MKLVRMQYDSDAFDLFIKGKLEEVTVDEKTRRKAWNRFDRDATRQRRNWKFRLFLYIGVGVGVLAFFIWLLEEQSDRFTTKKEVQVERPSLQQQIHSIESVRALSVKVSTGIKSVLQETAGKTGPRREQTVTKEAKTMYKTLKPIAKEDFLLVNAETDRPTFTPVDSVRFDEESKVSKNRVLPEQPIIEKNVSLLDSLQRHKQQSEEKKQSKKGLHIIW